MIIFTWFILSDNLKSVTGIVKWRTSLIPALFPLLMGTVGHSVPVLHLCGMRSRLPFGFVGVKQNRPYFASPVSCLEVRMHGQQVNASDFSS